MANILLGVTGSVAAIKTPNLYQLLGKRHQVRIVATTPSLYFFKPSELTPPERNPEIISLDEDEWPGRGRGQTWDRSDEVLHISLRRWADLFLIAPLDANTLAKLAFGLCDNCLTCVWRAWDSGKPRILAPAMNTLMWQNPATLRHFRLLASDCLGIEAPLFPSSEAFLLWFQTQNSMLQIIPPIQKILACGDQGTGAMAEVEDLVGQVDQILASD